MATTPEKASPAPLQTDPAFTVSNMMYPEDLMGDGNQYGGNYVIFYINVHEDSYLVANDKDKSAFVDGRATNRVQSAVAGMSAGGVEVGTKANSIIAASATNLGGRAVKRLGATPTGLLESVTNFAAGAVVSEATIRMIGGAKKSYKAMKDVIALHMPNDLAVRYGVSWSESELAGAMVIGATAENMGKAAANMSMSSVSSIAEGIFNAGAAGGSTAGSYLASKALMTPGIGGFLAKASGKAANPKKEQLFQDVDFRTFTFNYQFFPRSPSESEKIQKIIKAFKLHMHPEYKQDSGQFLYIYPSEFDIVYYTNGEENLNLHRHTSCVLTDLSVTYTPQGQYSAFADGSPTQINMNLTFKELALLTKETIDQGF